MSGHAQKGRQDVRVDSSAAASTGLVTFEPLAMVHAPGCKKPKVVPLCECGSNVACLTCRWGRGSMPCRCTPPPEVSNA